MSRCFPYPPPGYVRNGASGEALIESIKLQRERENANTERRKERKGEKKEKKQQKKREKKADGKEKPGEICDGEEKKFNDVKSCKGGSLLDSKGGHLQKRIEDEAELLEKSGLTEEHEQPICSENPCYSSDGTQNSNKRRMHTLPSIDSRNHGNIIRIRLPSQKPKEPNASLNRAITFTSGRMDLRVQQNYENAHAPGQGSTFTRTNHFSEEITRRHDREPDTSLSRAVTSTSGRKDLWTQQKYENAHAPGQEQHCSTSSRTNLVSVEITPRPDRELLCSTSGRTEIFAQDGVGTVLGSKRSKRFENKMQKSEALYKALIENWVPTSLQGEQTDYDDQQWLFKTEQQDRHVAKRLKVSNGVLDYGSQSLCPRAHYLPEADIYALPYTVPF
ncbi:hypothetical protein L1049_026594 [Liquidambar formosana]|uniref:Uncharacterized protein n=1 Tax=Liquidambar formosana TaxID=63359 RepID=A0AAP0R911_LIQFO